MKSFHRRSTRTPPRAAPSPSAAAPQRDRLRADTLLVARGLATSRAAAARLIADGRVEVDGEPVRKPSHTLPADAAVTVTDDND